MIRCIVFDFDGTLVQSNGIKRSAYYRTAERLGAVSDIVTKVLAECFGDRHEVLTAIVEGARAAERVPPGNGDLATSLAADFSRIVLEEIAVCPEVPGAMGALAELKGAGYPLYINSSTPSAPLFDVITRRRMGDFFRGVFGNEGGKLGNLRRAMAESGVGAAETLFVGDYEVDQAAAGELGCPFVGVINEFSDFKSEPRHRLRELYGLKALVESLA
jgi:phosphoglycolate phosphatase